MRRKDREVTDINEIKAILDSAKVMHMGMSDSGRPYVLPLNFGYIFDEEGVLCLYFHSAASGRKIEILKDNPSVFCEIDTELGLTGQGDNACSYSYAFASVMGPGTARPLVGDEEKIKALDILMKHQTGRDGFEYKYDLDKLAVFKVKLTSFSAKMAKPKA